MIKAILFGYLRHALTVGAGYLLAHGLVDQAGGQILASAGLAIAGVAWSTGQKMASGYELRLAQKAMSSGILPPPRIGPAAQNVQP
jgi:hypothetical protein